MHKTINYAWAYSVAHLCSKSVHCSQHDDFQGVCKLQHFLSKGNNLQ